MCVDPMTALSAASTVFSAVGSVVQGQGEASVDKANAKAALYQGYSQQNQERAKGRMALASQLASLSTRGVSVSSGTPLDLLAESAKNTELNALTIGANAQNQASAYRAKASAALKAGWFGAAGSILSGASKIADIANIGGGGTPGSSFDPGNAMLHNSAAQLDADFAGA